MALRGGTIVAGGFLDRLILIGLVCLPLHAQDVSSLVLAGIESAAVVRGREPNVRGTAAAFGRAVEAPFTPSQRLQRYLRRTYSVSRLGLLATDTALDHALREPACWDRGSSAYALRYTRAFQRRVVRNTAELGFGLLTREDLRYRRSRSASMSGRVWNGVMQAFLARMPDGSERPAYARFAAAAAAESSIAHWTGRPVQPGWLAESVGWATLDQIQTNLLDEFGPDLRRIGGRLWRRVRGLPEQSSPRP
jgi:hypothetical protein